MNKLFYKLMILLSMLISCSNSYYNDDTKEKEIIQNKEIKYSDINFDINTIPFGIINIADKNYSKIDDEIIKTLNAYKAFTNSMINIRGKKYYVSSIYTINTDDEYFYKQLEEEHYIYVSIWEIDNNKANFIAGFYPWTQYSYKILYIEPIIYKNMLLFEVMRYARKYEYTDYYRFNIEENNNIINFYLTNFTEKTPEYDIKSKKTKIAVYSFDKENINMNKIDKHYEY